jgi:hypothetical protein
MGKPRAVDFFRRVLTSFVHSGVSWRRGERGREGSSIGESGFEGFLVLFGDIFQFGPGLRFCVPSFGRNWRNCNIWKVIFEFAFQDFQFVI